ncbi:glycosyltransferase family 4 protein [Oerskovia jenensis]|uniref:D-inositol 3-phosphate glycosyltransferase n=1 Tax=Oerskovia jenensis TaxID=162169 RepID=A0ABS2LIG4_9CELL|nr:glycosyltransferase family 4 protein [Oerskovia jenensis]MBM7480062.1 glycosyltransferase involved in cell wall biosynthesis [Oerskovia jenensis]
MARSDSPRVDRRGDTPARHRLLLVTHHYAPETGAPQRRWGSLVARLVGSGVDVSVLAPPPHYPGGTLAPGHEDLRPGTVSTGAHGERIVRVRYREHGPSLVSRTADHLVAALSSVALGWRHLRGRDVRPTIVVGTVPGIPSMFAAWLLARMFRASLVVEMRDAWPDLIRPSGILTGSLADRRTWRALATTFAHRVITRLQSRADLVVTTTETFADVVRARGARDVAVVRNGTAFTSIEPTVDRASPGLAPRPFRAVYAGTLGRSQGLDVVVRAAALVAARGLAIEVRLVGAGSEAGRLDQLARSLGAPVTVAPSVPHEEIVALYAWSDTLVVSLRDWEPFQWTVPSKLYEVMASGRHVTACIAGEAAELVLALEAGDVVPPGDVDALADLWARFAAGGTPVAGRAAGTWVAAHANDDVLAGSYLALLDGLAR